MALPLRGHDICSRPHSRQRPELTNSPSARQESIPDPPASGNKCGRFRTSDTPTAADRTDDIAVAVSWRT